MRRTMPTLQALELRVPPPVVMLAAATLGWVAATQLPVFAAVLPLRAAIVTLFALTGLVLNLQPKWAFRQAGTTVNPLAPARTARLVSNGLYRHSRNPMYL